MAFVSSFCGASLSTPVSKRAVVTRPTARPAVRMSVAPLVETGIANVSEVSHLIAAQVNDFGGYTGPVLGLLAIGVIISVLTPPVKDE